MCTNNRYIKNHYVYKNILVPCGHCPACQQQKAAYRSNRIRNHSSSERIALFVTLTYTNEFIPFVYRTDFDDGFVTVYRLYSKQTIVRRRKNGVVVSSRVGDVEVLSEEFPINLPDDFDSRYLYGLKHDKSRIGVLFYKDLQDFFKRLRINLDRYENDFTDFTYFACSELGGFSKRPHFHVLLWIRPDQEQIFRRWIVKSWPYGNKFHSDRFIEVARNAASYVSSYVNCGNNFPKVFQINNEFKPKHSYSKGFGLSNSHFSLFEILEKVDEGSLVYPVRHIVAGVPVVDSVPLPKYAINRFFPLFKGFSRLPLSSLDVVLRSPECLRSFGNGLGIDYSDDDVHRIFTRIKHAFKDYIDYFGGPRVIPVSQQFNYERNDGFPYEYPRSFDDYIIDFKRVWTCYHSTTLRCLYERELGLPEQYDNIIELVDGKVKSLDFPVFQVSESLLDYNQHSHRLVSDMRLTDLYNRMNKQKMVTNEIMSEHLCLDV